MMPKISADPLSNKLDMLFTSENVDLLKKTSRVSTTAASASQPYLVGLLPSSHPPIQTTRITHPVSQNNLLEQLVLCVPTGTVEDPRQRCFNRCKTCKGPRTMAKGHAGNCAS